MGDQSFARLIKRRRDALGFSQARLGELVGRSASTIRNWERGNSTPSERSDAVALAAVLLATARPLDRVGQALLFAGQPLAAAFVFQDPDWKGVALYRAGRWAAAAERFVAAG